MTQKSRRGFAGMDPQKQKEIARKGGKAAHAKGTAHEFTPDEAREAGRKGGQAAHARGTAHQFTPEEAREAGRKGGRRSRGAEESEHTEPTSIPAEMQRPTAETDEGESRTVRTPEFNVRMHEAEPRMPLHQFVHEPV
jgi:general stress protein YciG